MKADIRRRLVRLEAKLSATKTVVRVPAITPSTPLPEAMRLYRAMLDGALIEDDEHPATITPSTPPTEALRLYRALLDGALIEDDEHPDHAPLRDARRHVRTPSGLT
jgi:hypothetical protein